MKLSSAHIWLAAAALLVGCMWSRAADAPAFFYNEIEKTGGLYVFAVPARYEAFMKSDGAELGHVIERRGYGPHGETVVFDSEDAINLYNYKHGLPGEPFPTPPQASEPEFPSSKISGLMFGDYFWFYQLHRDQVSSADPTPIPELHGLWFRRLYFTYDFAYSERLSTRFRLEANSNGDFEGGDIVPHVKDASMKWTYTGKQQLTLGIHPTLTFDWLDEFWGLRHIEKTPADLYRLDSSRDFGFTLSGSAPIDGHSYAVQCGNESGNGSETQEGKILRFESHYARKTGIVLEGFYSFGTRPEGARRHTAQGIAGLRNSVARAGAQYLWQHQTSDRDGAPNHTISVWSGFAVWERRNRVDLFFRVDGVTGDVGGVETGLSGAEDIDYFLLSSRSPFTTWILGGQWRLHPDVRLSPNLELVRYSNDPDPANFPGRHGDSILRFTFFWTF
jgi:hypothetical protein